MWRSSLKKKKQEKELEMVLSEGEREGWQF